MDGYFDKNGHPQIVVKLEGLTNQPILVPCLIDTGFDGYLTLPQSIGIRLGLLLFGTTNVELADGTLRNELLYFCKVTFCNEEKIVPVALSNSAMSLLGTKLIDGKRLLMNFKSRTVRITPLVASKPQSPAQPKLFKKTTK